jgi:glycosyltransferase involved in cell wall biosynthesis
MTRLTALKLAYCVRAIFPQHGYGGLERAGTDLMRHLLLAGADVALFTRPFPGAGPIAPPEGAPGRLTVHTVRYERMPVPLPMRPNSISARLTNYPAFVEDMGRRVERFALKGYVQAVYAHGLCAWGVRRAAQWGVPTVANPHGLEEFKVRDPLKWLAYAPFRAWVRAGCRAAHRVVATDHAMRSEVTRLLRLDPDKVVVIPNGVDVQAARSLVSPKVRERLAERWPALASPHLALKGISVGRMEANKGFDRLLRALARALPGDDWVWFMVGEGTARPALEALASTLGLSEQVVFTGQVTDAELHNLYEVCELFALPSLYEGSSLVTLEAMAHGLPVVATRVGGIPDKVIEGETGFLVPPGDEAGLADRLAWMAHHPQERARMGEAGARLAAQRFDWHRIALQTVELFERLLDEALACRTMEVPSSL